MTAIRGIAPFITIALGVLAFVVLSRGKVVESRPPTETKAPLVDTEEAQLHTKGLDIEVDGMVVPFRDVEVSAEVAGRVIRKLPACETGEFVSVGTPLFEIDPQDYDLEVKRLKKQQAQSDREIEEVKVQIENTDKQIKLAQETLDLEQTEVARLKRVYETGDITQSEYDDALHAGLMARDALLAHQNQRRVHTSRGRRLLAAKEVIDVQLARAEIDLKRTKVTSPIDGVVIGERVQQDGFATKGAVLVMIQDTAKMEVKCNLRVEDVYWILQQLPPDANSDPKDRHRRAFKIPPTEATVVFESNFAWDGVLERLDGVGLDAETRLVPCRIVVKDPLAVKYIGPVRGLDKPTGPASLLRNMYVQNKIHAKPRTKLLRISEKALRPGGSVWVVRDGKLKIIPVTVVKRWKDEVLIDGSTSKLKSGDKVVVSPVSAVRQGMEVREKSAS